MKSANDLKFSIIIPAFNSEKYIEKAVQSVLNQIYKNFELIIVNDGSVDRTLSIVEEYAKKDNRISVISKNNGGYVSAVNTGLDRISGDYFLLMGSDDYLASNLLSTVVANIIELSPDIIVFKSLQVKGDEQFLDSFSNFDNCYSITDSSLFENIKNKDNGMGLLCNRDTSKIFKTSLLQNQRYFGKTGIDADDVFSMRLARRSSVFLFVPVIGYYWTVRPDSIMGRKPSKSAIVDTIKVFCDYFYRLPKGSTINYFEKQYLNYNYFSIINLCKRLWFVFGHYFLIKKTYYICYSWIKNISRVKLKYRLPYIFPITYCIYSKVKLLFKSIIAL